MSKAFSDRLLTWYDQYGRHDLPWQLEQTPYRVWVSEIMLQQTQVVTVIPYYQRFMDRFPDVKALAKASQDDVMHRWTGLGYYARARNLHKAAKMVVDEFKGCFPQTFEQIISLPGIGRSTAGAILSLACGQRYPILDGNVKRVLTRYYAIAGWPGKKPIENQLWDYAEQHTPVKDFDKYTQAIMDLGATICLRRNPLCENCPVNKDCQARLQGRQHDYPESKPRTAKPERQTIFAIIENDQGQVLLEQRPPSGIWGGLWCFPEIEMDASVSEEVNEKYGYHIKETIEYNSIQHTFSHFHLQIKPIHLRVEYTNKQVNDATPITWIKPGTKSNKGLPAPVVSLLQDLTKH